MNLDLLFSFPHAFLAGLAVAVACSLLSPFVVYKRMAFAGEGISHAGFAGVGLAFLVGLWWPAAVRGGWIDLFLVVACVVTALGIGRLTALAAIEADAAIGVGLVVAMAVGIASMDLYFWLRPQAYVPGIQHNLLFGDIFSADAASSVWAWSVAALTAALIATAYKQLVFYTFDEEGALVFGAPVRATRYLFLALMALAIVAAMRLVGVILVTALLVIPGLIGRALAATFGRALLASLTSGVVGMLAGLLLVVALEVFSSGPIVVLTLAAMLAGALTIERVRAWRRRRHAFAE